MEINWERHSNHLEAHLYFKDFKTCFGFVAQVALLAEQRQHHPDIHIHFNHLCLMLRTHDAGNTITSKDEKMAAEIAALAEGI
jgi:4a-hydroxytetrahydrobiopterin dehydratase